MENRASFHASNINLKLRFFILFQHWIHFLCCLKLKKCIGVVCQSQIEVRFYKKHIQRKRLTLFFMSANI
ncbi:hypothetical protein BpHYR1_054017 [Brachionus plicatilis]|uniref:Uncharacterized protein n=1 Tax=Brachionus plicatilis TaxID=10195 RepID=A0A3M7PU97_BRAPC|nr:hypothetical protein BpHYR1_054017 [Brachionus plicatilis]